MHRTKQPLYIGLANHLRQGILDQRWKPGDLLPSETELCREHSISRGTVVRALDLLLEGGFAHRRQGFGTIVSRPALRRMPGFVRSFSETVKAQGCIPTHRLVGMTELSRKQALQYGCEEAALCIHRVRLVDNTPWAIHHSLIPMHIARQTSNLYGPDSCASEKAFSLYSALEKAGFTVDCAEEVLNARLVTEEEAGLLNIETPEAVMLVHRKSFDTTGTLLELTEATYLSNCYSYEVHLLRTLQPVPLTLATRE